MSDSEKKWAQIENEALAVLYEKIDQYTFGRKVTYFQYIKGTELVIAGTLSRAFDPKKKEATDTRARTMSIAIFEEFPDERINDIRKATEEDYVLYKLREIILEGWPEKESSIFL